MTLASRNLRQQLSSRILNDLRISGRKVTDIGVEGLRGIAPSDITIKQADGANDASAREARVDISKFGKRSSTAMIARPGEAY